MWDVPQLFQNTVKSAPERTAIVDPIAEQRFSYAEVDEKVDRIAAGLQSFGIEKGDRVGVAHRNSPENVFVLLAIQRVGAVAVPFNFDINNDKLRYFVSDADMSMLVFGDVIADQVMDLREELECNTFVTTADVSAPDVTDYEALLRESDAPDPVSIGPDDTSIIQYSSGTTGDPKGIEITHRGGINRVFLNIHSQRVFDRETVLGRIHLYHTLGFHGLLLSAFVTGGTFIPFPEFDPDLYRRVIAEEDVTVLHEAPVIYQRLLDPKDEFEQPDADEDRETFESVETVSFSAAPMSGELFGDIKRIIDPDQLYNIYGMTEIFSSYTKVNLREKNNPAIFAYAETAEDMRIVEIDERDPSAEVGVGEEGELIVRHDTPGAFEGYLRDYETAGDSFEGDWYFTGDACLETEDGYYRLTGRLSNRIKFIGENIYPKNIEAVLRSHPAVEATTVVGIEDDEWGEVPKAYVVADGDVTAEQLQDHCVESEAIEDYKKPREFEFVDTLPNSGSKI
ncbi:class I adenylate-forming enzyme family protein [Halorussus caseinilyticus]|uniref:Class I adenylate-forming enzyme family protein n=1 Tax=Halorussus caseinilyticus TaxID=3034025 RepID=A0ABD5WGB4_9EURY|nr:class I adenylate-forming enzyme family protein [Halorussus sp. DT72]